MTMSSKTFDKIRFYAEIIGHILTFVLAVSDKLGFEYGFELAGIVAAANIMLGSIVETSRRHYNEQEGEADDSIN